MKTGKMRNILLADILVLLLLFLASSTDLLIKEEAFEVHKIAVMVDMPVKGQVDNFRAGAMKAAAEYHADINFINLSVWNEMEDKQAVLRKELDNGCKGIILHCEKEAEIKSILEEIPAGIQVLLYNADVEDADVQGKVGSDAEEEGRLLLEAVLQDEHPEERVVLVEMASCGERVLLLHDLIQTQLEAEGLLVRRVQVEKLSEIKGLLKGMPALSGGTLVSADIAVLQTLGEENASLGDAMAVYGVGFHSGIRRLIEEGHISGSVVHRAYEAGYFSVERMIRLLAGESFAEKKIIVEAALVTQKNMYLPEMENIVFPYV